MKQDSQPSLSGTPGALALSPVGRWPSSVLGLLFSVFCVLSSVLCPLSSFALESAEQLQFADGLYARGMWDTALKEYTLYLTQNSGKPASDAVYFRIGECHRSLGHTNEADAAYARVLAEYPDGEFHYRAGLRRAELLEQAGKTDEQIHLLVTLLVGNPPAELGAACRYSLGLALEKQGKVAEATEAYEAILTKYAGTPFVSYAALALAGLDRKAGGTRAAGLYLAAATNAVTPRAGAESWFQLGDFLYAQKDYEKSAEAYEKLATKYPADERVPQSQLQRAWALHHAKRDAEALIVCTAVLETSGLGKAGARVMEKTDEWLYLKANCERQVMKNEDAVATYDALLNSFPTSSLADSAAYERALALFTLGRYREAVEQARGLLANERVKPDACWLLAESSAALKDDAAAVQYYRILADQYPSSPLAADALYRLAHLLQKKNDYVQAAELFGRLETRFPKHELAAQAVFAQAACLGRAQKNEAAVAAYARLLATYPQSPFVEDALYQKASAETFLRRDAQARETWRDLLTHFPATKYAADAYFWNGVLLEEAAKLEEAEAAFRTALKTTPAPSDDLRGRIQFRLALTLQRRGTLEEAAGLLQGLIASPMRDKFPSELLEWLAGWQLTHLAFDKALLDADQLTTVATTENWKQIASVLRGKALMGQGKPVEARQAFEHVVAIGFKSQALAEAWLRLGSIDLAAGVTDKAKRAFEEAASLAASDTLLPIRVQAYAGIGRALKAQGKPEEAARHFMSVAVLFDDPVLVPECLYEAACAFTAAGRKEDGKKAATELGERYPGSEWIKKLK